VENPKKRWPKLLGLALASLVTLAALFIWSDIQLERDPNELALGAPVPTLNLLDTTGKPLSFAPAEVHPVLVFYRGKW